MEKRLLRLVDHYLGRFNAGAQQRTKFPTCCAQTGASCPLQRHRWRDCQSTALPGCPVPLRLRNVYKVPAAVQVASSLRMRPRMFSDLTHDAGETSPCNQADISHAVAFICGRRCMHSPTFFPILLPTWFLPPRSAASRVSSRDWHSCFLLAQQPFVGVHRASASPRRSRTRKGLVRDCLTVAYAGACSAYAIKARPSEEGRACGPAARNERKRRPRTRWLQPRASRY